MLFTTEQTESWQRDILIGAAQRNELHELAWFIQMILPLSKAQARTMTQRERIDYRYRTACAPGQWVPYIPVGDDPAVSRCEAEILAAIFAAANPPTIKFTPALCLIDDLAQHSHYEYGSEWDYVCGRCGGIFTSTLPYEAPLCEQCCQFLYRMAMY